MGNNIFYRCDGTDEGNANLPSLLFSKFLPQRQLFTRPCPQQGVMATVVWPFAGGWRAIH